MCFSAPAWVSPALVGTRGATARKTYQVERRLLRCAFYTTKWLGPLQLSPFRGVELNIGFCDVHFYTTKWPGPLQLSPFPGVKLSIEVCDVHFYTIKWGYSVRVFTVSWCKIEHRLLRCALLHHKVARVIFDPLQFSTFPGVKLNIDFCDVQFYKTNGALLKTSRSIFGPGHIIKLKISFCDVQFYKANGALLKTGRCRSTGEFAQNGRSKSFW